MRDARPPRRRQRPESGEELLTDEERAELANRPLPDDEVEAASQESFPASDPPPFTPTKVGQPARPSSKRPSRGETE